MDNNGQKAPDKLLTIEDLAEYFQVSKKTVYRLVKQKQIPAVRIAHQVRFRKEDIESWLEKKVSEDMPASG